MPGYRICVCSVWAALTCCAGDVYAPLRLYEGGWKLVTKGQATTVEIVNQCNLTGQYFACEQKVDGKVGSLIVFVPGANVGDYFVQSVMPDGRASGRVDLRIDGNLWTYSNKVTNEGKTKYYRTTNLFTTRDRIHYEQSESAEGTNWTVVASGDETRGH